MSETHKDRATKHYDRDAGECMCEYCKVLPWHLPTPAAPVDEVVARVEDVLATDGGERFVGYHMEILAADLRALLAHLATVEASNRNLVRMLEEEAYHRMNADSKVATVEAERDEAITKWARAAEEAHDATARADRLQATLDGLAAKVEGMLVDLPSPHGGTVAEDFVRARNRALHAVLTLLDPWRGPDPQPVRLDLDTDE